MVKKLAAAETAAEFRVMTEQVQQISDFYRLQPRLNSAIRKLNDAADLAEKVEKAAAECRIYLGSGGQYDAHDAVCAVHAALTGEDDHADE